MRIVLLAFFLFGILHVNAQSPTSLEPDAEFFKDPSKHIIKQVDYMNAMIHSQNGSHLKLNLDHQ